MRTFVALNVLVALAACSQPVAPALVGNVPEALKLPSCESLKVANHWQSPVGNKTSEFVVFRADSDCVQSWTEALGKDAATTGVLVVSFDSQRNLASVTRMVKDPNVMIVSWNHDGSAPAIIGNGEAKVLK